MKTKLLIWLFVPISVMIIACEDMGSGDHSHDAEMNIDSLRTMLQEKEKMYAEGENEKNVDKIMQYYADDAHNLPDDEPTVKGAKAIRDRIEREMAEDTTSGGNIRFEVVDVFAGGDLLVEVGHSIRTDAEGNEYKGKYMSLFENRDGKYVCIRDIWNSDDDYDDEEDEDDEEDNMGGQ